MIDDVFRYGGGDDPGQDLRKMMTEVKQTDHGPDIFKQVGCSKRHRPDHRRRRRTHDE